jgi:hypothetical protein
MMHCRLLPLAGLLAMTSACSSSSGDAPQGDLGDLDAQAAAPSDDDADSNEASSEASTTFDSGPVDEPHEAGPATSRDAGSGTGGGQRLACYEAAVGICQSAIVPPSGVASWNSNCKFQGGTTDSCPTTGLVGCCIGETNHYCYYTADYTLATAQQNCSIMNGTWSTSL